jgi:hypothetical protein
MRKLKINSKMKYSNSDYPAKGPGITKISWKNCHAGE